MKRLALVALLAVPASGAPGEVVRVEHRDPSALPSRGPSNAPVTIELFFTPGPQSRQTAYRMVEHLAAEHPTKIRLIYRIVAGSNSARFPYAALEAQAEGKFFEFMEQFHKAATSSSGLTDQALAEIAKRVGLDAGRFAAALKGPAAYRRVLDANNRRSKQRRASALPSVLFNGRLPQRLLTALGPQDLEREYMAAKDLAEDELDRGVDPAVIADPPIAASPQDIVVMPGATDEELEAPPAEPPLASPPLELDGLPSFGPPSAGVTIAVLCTPKSDKCAQPLRAARITQDLYPEAVRVVWAPLFDVASDDAAELGLLADAALCAEQVGTSSESDFESPSSPGWRWVEVMASEATPRHRRISGDQLIDKVATKLHVEPRAFATCRARLAGTAMAWIESARHAGVRTTPSTVLGGRIYGPITDWNTLQLLVEAELAPDVLDALAPALTGR